MVPPSPSVERVVSSTRNSGNQWHFSVLRTEGAVQCIISRSTSREWDPGDARLRKEDRREADDLEIRFTGLVTLVARTPVRVVDARRGFESPTREREFSTRFHEPFVPDIRDTYDRV